MRIRRNWRQCCSEGGASGDETEITNKTDEESSHFGSGVEGSDDEPVYKTDDDNESDDEDDDEEEEDEDDNKSDSNESNDSSDSNSSGTDISDSDLFVINPNPPTIRSSVRLRAKNNAPFASSSNRMSYQD